MLLTDSEWKIMNCLWRHSPLTARDVREELQEETEWAYTTVKTLMNRLVDKGLLEARKRANTSYYRPLLSRGQARSEAFHNFLERAFDGTLAPFLGFLKEEDLSEADRKTLKRMLEEREEADGDA